MFMISKQQMCNHHEGNAEVCLETGMISILPMGEDEP